VATFKPLRKSDLRILALTTLTALFVWTFNALNKDNYTTWINFPLEVQFEQENVVAVKAPPASVRVSITGMGWNLLQKRLGINVQPILRELRRPTEIKYLTARSLRRHIEENLQSVQVNYLEPDTIFFDYDTLLRKNAVVLVDSSGLKMEPGYRRISPFQIEPYFTAYVGAKRIVEKQSDTLWIHPQESEIEDNFEDKFGIRYEKSDLLHLEPERVQLKFRVAKFVERRALLPVQPLNFPEDSSAYPTPDTVEVRFFVREEHKERPLPDSLFAQVDREAYFEGDTAFVPEVVLPPFCVDAQSLDTLYLFKDEKKKKSRNYRRNW